MPSIPTPIRAALGLAATAVDEARKLPETLPQAVTTVPMLALSTAMQASMKVQQRITELAIRGDEVLSLLHGKSSDAPAWATFDDAPAESSGADDPTKAAFDRIDYETGFSEGDEAPGRWDAVGVGGTEPDASSSPASPDGPAINAEPAGGESAAAGAATSDSADSESAVSASAVSESAVSESADAPSAEPVIEPFKTPAKKAAKKSPAAKVAEPLEEAAAHAKPSPVPNPATMAAEIVHAHEAEAEGSDTAE